MKNDRKDLEKAADHHTCKAVDAVKRRGWELETQDITDAFIAGAEWQKEQFEKNRLAHCDALSKENYDRETDFAMEIIEKEHRQPTFIDAINYGMRLQKEQMMKGAVEGVARPDDCEIWVNLVGYGYKFNDGDKVRIIVLPKED